MSTKPLEELSDEELLELNAPPAVGESSGSDDVPTPSPEVEETAAQPVEPEPATPVAAEESLSEEEPDNSPAPTDPETPNPENQEVPQNPGVDPKDPTTPVETPVLDYKAEYEKLMAPLRANGKDIELKSPEELISLAQMGANYTKNMQNIRHHKKTLLMLEKNGLLDESKISYLIDLSNGNPAAIQKLLKEKNIDPLDVDIRGETTYQDQGNHRLSDDEVIFRERVEEIASTPEGTETIAVFNSWDQPSKDLLWRNPELMSTIHKHRLNGTYDVVANEVARRQAVGTISPTIPFLQAYEQVGEELVARQRQSTVATPVATRVATPAAQVKNDQRAAAAAPTRTGSRRATPIVNPLALSDEEFEKEFAKFTGRL